MVCVKKCVIVLGPTYTFALFQTGTLCKMIQRSLINNNKYEMCAFSGVGTGKYHHQHPSIIWWKIECIRERKM